jgi:release factor glutamine methyltransferase
VAELLRVGRSQLRAAGVGSPGLDAQVLLAEARGVGRTQVLAGLVEDVPAAARERFEALVARRVRREPLAYIVGWREFWGHRFAVNGHVLIPRPETELLVQRALELAGDAGGVAVDVGTGSGCIAVSVALDAPRLRVYATDTSAEALRVARFNARTLGVTERVGCLPGSLLEPVPEPADMVLANLPYVPTADLAGLQEEVRNWEPRAALDGGVDGLDAIRALLTQLPGRVRPGGYCLLEMDPRQRDPLEDAARRTLPGVAVGFRRDLAGRLRLAELGPFTPS